MSKLLITADCVIAGPALQVTVDGAVLVESGVIAAVGTAVELRLLDLIDTDITRTRWPQTIKGRPAKSGSSRNGVRQQWESYGAFPGLSAPIRRHERETVEMSFLQASSHQSPIAAGHDIGWSPPGHLTSMIQYVRAAHHRYTPRDRV
ncbi:hypothetical protein ABZ686_08730 [Streptomyces sp. NPDC006992]|uniref:hypothetical protein n=1 Tax=Streptomyces sp. NPDC006992 TaxID=3155601 RepID=UPI00340E15FB